MFVRTVAVCVLVAAINVDIRVQVRGRPLLHLPPTIKGSAGLFKVKINGHKRSSGAQLTSGGDDKTFAVFFCLSLQQTGWRDKVTGSRGQTIDPCPRRCTVIFCAVGSGVSHRRLPPPHRDSDYFLRGTMF